jgi:hypothetical protein
MPSTSLIETSIHAREGTYAILDANSCELRNLHADVAGVPVYQCAHRRLQPPRSPQKEAGLRSRRSLPSPLYTRVLDDSTFKNERQRVQVAIDSLTAAFFGCRPCSWLDTRVKFDDFDNPDIPTDDTVVASPPRAREVVNDVEMDEIKDVKSNCDGETESFIGAACETDGGLNKP